VGNCGENVGKMWGIVGKMWGIVGISWGFPMNSHADS